MLYLLSYECESFVAFAISYFIFAVMFSLHYLHYYVVLFVPGERLELPYCEANTTIC